MPSEVPGLAARRIAADILEGVLHKHRTLDDQLDGAAAHPGLKALPDRDRRPYSRPDVPRKRELLACEPSKLRRGDQDEFRADELHGRPIVCIGARVGIPLSSDPHRMPCGSPAGQRASLRTMSQPQLVQRK